MVSNDCYLLWKYKDHEGCPYSEQCGIEKEEKTKPWYKMSDSDIVKIKQEKCAKCVYRCGVNFRGTAAGILCNYLEITGHMRGCRPDQCDKFKKGKKIEETASPRVTQSRPKRKSAPKTPQQRAQEKKERYARLKADGICIDCGKGKVIEGTVRCQKCTERRVRYNRAYREKKKEEREHGENQD